MNTLITDRLVLRPVREDDAQAVYRNWSTDERVAEHCTWHPHKNIDVTKAYIEHCIKMEYCWAITLKGSDEPIGIIEVVGKNSAGVDELGYVLMHDQWGKGIMTEAVKAVIKELFELGFEKVGACHHTDNPASGKVMRKSGMKFVRSGEIKRKFDSDELIPIDIYEISKN